MDTGDGVLAEESVCQVDDFGEKRIMLDECYGGSQPQTYIYREALSCICQRSVFENQLKKKSQK